MSACDRQATVFLSLDISTALAAVDHNTLLDRISGDFGILNAVCRR